MYCNVRLSPRTTIGFRDRRKHPSRRFSFRARASTEPGPPSDEPGKEITESQPNLQLPQSVVARLRDTVFGPDTLFVTSVENYGLNGVLFKGNLRGTPSVAYSKLKTRLNEELSSDYKLFLIEDQEEKPVAVVIPAESAETQVVNPAAESFLAVVLGIATICTTLNVNGAELFDAALLTAKFDPTLVTGALPASVAFLAILGAHEIGHIFGAQRAKLEVAFPLFLPAGLGLIGAFGAITRIKSSVPNREALATVAVPGPLAGTGVSLAVVLVGLALTAGGVGGIDIDSASFRESFLIGGLGQVLFGDRLFTAAALSCNPLFVAGWAGLLVNAINAIPAGELDGGKIFLALFGRRAASRMSALSLFLLGIGGISNGLALFWLLLVLTLQRQPVVPCDEELTPLPRNSMLERGAIVALVVPLLILLPYPFAPSLPEIGDFIP